MSDEYPISEGDFSDVLQRKRLLDINYAIGFQREGADTAEFAGIDDHRIVNVNENMDNGFVNLSPPGEEKFYKIPLVSAKLFIGLDKYETLQKQNTELTAEVARLTEGLKDIEADNERMMYGLQSIKLHLVNYGESVFMDIKAMVNKALPLKKKKEQALKPKQGDEQSTIIIDLNDLTSLLDDGEIHSVQVTYDKDKDQKMIYVDGEIFKQTLKPNGETNVS